MFVRRDVPSLSTVGDGVLDVPFFLGFRILFVMSSAYDAFPELSTICIKMPFSPHPALSRRARVF